MSWEEKNAAIRAKDAEDKRTGSGQSLPREVEGVIELGCIRPDLLTAAQVHELAWFAKRRLENERRPMPIPRAVAVLSGSQQQQFAQVGSKVSASDDNALSMNVSSSSFIATQFSVRPH